MPDRGKEKSSFGPAATDRKRKQTAEAAAEFYRALIETAPDVIFSISAPDGALTSLNPAFERITGWAREEWLGKPFWPLIHPEDRPLADKAFQEVTLGKTPLPFELRVQAKSGDYLLGEFTWAPRVEKGRIVGALGIVRDITERKRLEDTIRQLAYHDPVTGLPNRVLFNDRLQLAMAHSRRWQQKLVIMLLDLDRFKDVNDGLGHSVGDRLLKAVGERLTALLRKSDTVARLGGDEFLLLLPDVVHEEDADKIAAKILEAVRQPFTFGQQQLRVTTSVGIAIYPSDGETVDALMSNADVAMYRAKDRGRDNCQRYTPELQRGPEH